jgi:alkaline phosphatase
MSDAAEMSRRAILYRGSLLLGAWSAAAMQSAGAPALTFGIVTDLHHANKPERGSRYYRESIPKLREAAAEFRSAALPFVVELGDLVDAAEDADTELSWLKEAIAWMRAAGAGVHYVLGNHCVQTLRKKQFLTQVGRERGHYSFDRGGVRFIVLDACYRKDGASYDAGNFDWKDTDIPFAQRKWLSRDLGSAPGRAVIFVHQRLDIHGVHSVASAEHVREILERSGKVLAIFQGHSHQNDYRHVGGLHYCTMRAVVEGSGMESSGYSVVSVFGDGRLAVKGFRAQSGYNIGRETERPG